MAIKKIIDKIFEMGILIKALVGFFEILGGLLFAFSTKIITDNFIIDLAKGEVSEDPNDAIANFLIKTATNLSQDTHLFAVAYLLFHGAVNIFLSISLVKEKVKHYPAIIAFLFLFIFYQVYRYFHTYSLTLLLLTLFDVFFVAIIWLEYKKSKKNSTIIDL